MKRYPPNLILVATLFYLSLLASTPAAFAAGRIESGGFSVLTDNAPGWVIDPAMKAPSAPRKSGKGYHHELLDWQSDFTGKEAQHYFRAMIAIDETSGLSEASAVNAAYNPAYETLIFHHVHVIRDGKILDKLTSARLTLARREAQLEQSVYDGVVSADLLLEDVRVGDRISVAYTVRGSNPVFGSRVDVAFPLAARNGVDVLHVRLRVPSATEVNTRFFGDAQGAQTSTTGNVREYVLRREQVPPLPDEQDWPAWYNPASVVQFSEYASWADVARWAQALFEKSKPWSPQLQQVIAGIKAQNKGAEGSARAALDFVQNEVRYVALAMGEGSHRPSHPNEVLTRRFGDCKDKTVLLIAMLRELGVTADPALVSYRHLRNVQQWLPSPGYFDHVIVRAQIDGKTYWLDGTRTFQKGPLARRGLSPFGKALVVSPATTSLVDLVLPAESKATIVRRQEFTLQKLSASARLVSESLYTGEQAEYARSVIAIHGQPKVDDEALRHIQEYYPNTQKDGDTVLEDNAESNSLVIRRYYKVDDLFEKRGDQLVGGFPAMYLTQLAKLPRTSNRKTPYGLYYPVEEKQVVVVNGPFLAGIRTRPPTKVETPYFSFSSRSELAGTRLTMEHDYRALTDAVPASEVTQHASRVREMQRALYSELYFSQNESRKPPPSRSPGKDVVDELKDLLK